MNEKNGKNNIDLKPLIKKIENMDSFSDMEKQIEEFMPEGKGADNVAKVVKEKMKINQLRNFFEKIKKLQRNKNKLEDAIEKKELYILLPELAYAYGRELITEDVYRLLKICVQEKIKRVKDLNSFVDFLSAIIAYHKFHKK